MIPKRIVVISFFFLSFAVFVCARNADVRIEFKEVAHNFGTINRGDIVKHTFRFENTGKDVLEIRNVKASCGCTTAELKDKKIKPGKSGKIEVSFDSKGYRGHVRKSITVETNSSSHSKVFLYLEADVTVPPQPDLSVVPREPSLGLVLKGSAGRVFVELVSRGEERLVIESVKPNVEGIEVRKPAKFPVKLDPGERCRVELVISGLDKTGIYSRFVEVISNDLDNPRSFFRITGYVTTEEEARKLLDGSKN